MQPSHLWASCCCTTRNLSFDCFILCSIATRCSVICVPDRPIEPLLLQLFVQVEGHHQRSVGTVKLPFIAKVKTTLQQHTATQTRAQHTSLSHPGVDGKNFFVAMFTLHFPPLVGINEVQIPNEMVRTPWSRNASHNAYQFTL